MRKEIVYIPLGSTLRAQLYREELLKAASIYAIKGRIITLSFPLKKRSYNPRRRQFSALMLLNQVCKLKFDKNFPLCMGITAADVYFPGMNFIFGIADNARGCAVLSVARLTYAQYEAGSELLKERVLKEVAHELGHLIGLNHCDNPDCLMAFSINIAEVDRKKTKLCDRCRSFLELDRQK